MIGVHVSFPRLKLAQRLWLCVAVVILLLVSNSIVRKYQQRQSRHALVNLRAQLFATREEERVLSWLLHDLTNEFESLRHYETVHVEGEMKPSRKVGGKYHWSNALKEFQKTVTILIYSKFDTSSCVMKQIRSVRKSLLDVRIVVVTSAVFSVMFDDNINVLSFAHITEGKALNLMIEQVQTEYFLYLSEGAELPDFNSENSPFWLFEAHRRFPELDVIGGSMLRVRESERKITIPCYRLQACDWVIQQSFQYKYIVDDIMACEETAKVFMAKHSNILSIGQFDEVLPTLVTTDFFYRAKQHGAIVAVRPRFVYRVTDQCSEQEVDATLQTEVNRAFFNNHDFVELRLASGYNITISDVKLPLSAYQWFVKLTHPFQVKGAHGSAKALDVLHDMMVHLDRFFKMRNTLYVVAWGATLASIKMRHLLPYDASIDVDLLYDAPWRLTYDAFIRHSRLYCPHYSVGNVRWSGRNEIIIFDRRNLVVTSLVSHWNDPDFPFLPEHLFMIPLGGRFFPADRRMIRINREYYGLDYLAMKGHDAETMYCSVPGHHACVPLSYAHGGGYWSDFRCRL